MSEPLFHTLVVAFVATHLAPFLAPVAYARSERAHRGAWQTFPAGREIVEPSAYRSSGPVVTGHLERAPGLVRVAAASAIVFGAMFLPGLSWGLFGLVAGGFGLLSIPGLLIAAFLWRAGHSLLRGTAEGAVDAARIASVSFYFNALLVLGALSVAVLSRDSDALAVSALVGVYACCSIAQALLLGKAASLGAELHGETLEGVVEAKLPFVLRHLIERKRARVARRAAAA